MGEPNIQNSSENVAGLLAGLQKGLPGILNAMNTQVGPAAEAQLKAAQATSPAYNQLLTDLYKQYGPQTAAVGTQIDTANRAAQAQTDSDLLRRYGVSMAQGQRASDNALNPEAAATTALTGTKLDELLNSINLNNANPEAERLVNQEAQRSGNANVGSATGTVSNALSFGNEMQKRRNALGQALTQATQFIPAATKNNATMATLNKGTNNAGQTQFAGVSSPTNQSYQTGGQLLDSLTGLKTQSNQMNYDNTAVNKTSQILGSL